MIIERDGIEYEYNVGETFTINIEGIDCKAVITDVNEIERDGKPDILVKYCLLLNNGRKIEHNGLFFTASLNNIK